MPIKNQKLSGYKNMKNQNKKPIKKEDRKGEISRITGLFDKSMTADGIGIEEILTLINKDKLTEQETKRLTELQQEVTEIHGLKNGVWAGATTYQKYRNFIYTTRATLVKEYDCKTSLELMLADRIVANYWRAMRIETLLCPYIEWNDDYAFSQLRVNIIKELSKSLESASRQMTTNILLLKEMKQPGLNVKIHAGNAFVGQNQQFNLNKHETIEPT
jgi:hypothetical protein